MYLFATGIVINILSIIVLSAGLFHRFEHPKQKAIYGYIITASMIMYILLLGFIAIYGLFVNHNLLYNLILFLCVISPFIIGKSVNYNSLKLYTIIQILCFLFSLIILLILL